MTARPAHAVLARSASVPRFGGRFGALAALAVALALLGLGACSVNRRSDEYARCSNPAQCPSGMCDQGVCVPVGAPGDAAPGTASDARPGAGIDAGPQPACPSVCSECNNDTCLIACAGPNACPVLVTCPAGWECEVECLGDQSCPAGVSCGQAKSCAVLCDGNGACEAGVSCGPGPCDVECLGLSACLVIDCSESCACDTECDDGAVCTRQCPARGANCQRNEECSSFGCDEC
jgi:hypothetical protein